MSRPHVDLVVVCGSGGEMVGVLTKTDVVRQIRQCTGGSCVTRVDAVMTRDVVACRPGQWLHDIWSVMKERSLQRIPMVDQDGRPLGMIDARDALESLLSETENEESLLRDYVMCVGYR